VELDFFAGRALRSCFVVREDVLFFLPAGIGVQDVGYVSCLAALGVPDALTWAPRSRAQAGKELFFGPASATVPGLRARQAVVDRGWASVPRSA